MWGEGILSAPYVLKRISHKKTGETPCELWKSYAPNLNYFKLWGCLAKVPFPKSKKRRIRSEVPIVFLFVMRIILHIDFSYRT